VSWGSYERTTISKGTQEDVERIVRRDFVPAELDAAFALLDA